MPFKKDEIAKGAKPFTKNDPRINKKGRPKVLPDLNDLLIETLTKDELIEILKARRSNAKTKFGTRDTELLLDRAYGKVKQDLNIHGGITLHFDKDDAKL
jgi:hypothetical protein